MFSKLSALLVCSLAAVSALAAPPVRRQIQLGGNAGGGGVGTREISGLLPGVSGHGGHADGVGNVAGHLTGIITGGLAGAAGGAIGGDLAGGLAGSATSTVGGVVDGVTGDALSGII